MMRLKVDPKFFWTDGLVWFKLCFNCYKYKHKHIITEKIKFPGSDKKPKACPKVIS